MTNTTSPFTFTKVYAVLMGRSGCGSSGPSGPSVGGVVTGPVGATVPVGPVGPVVVVGVEVEVEGAFVVLALGLLVGAAVGKMFGQGGSPVSVISLRAFRLTSSVRNQSGGGGVNENCFVYMGIQPNWVRQHNFPLKDPQRCPLTDSGV
jgi:hypothetical protein